MSQAFVDQVTLDFLLNKEMYNSHVNNKKITQVNKEERKLYKKRVYNLFKEIIMDSEPEDLLPDVKYLYNNFLNASIQYLKMKDKNDVIQAEYKDFVFDSEESQVIQDVSLNTINQQENNLEADKLMMRSIKMPPVQTLDKPSLKKNVSKNSAVENNPFKNILREAEQPK